MGSIHWDYAIPIGLGTGGQTPDRVASPGSEILGGFLFLCAEGGRRDWVEYHSLVCSFSQTTLSVLRLCQVLGWCGNWAKWNSHDCNRCNLSQHTLNIGHRYFVGIATQRPTYSRPQHVDKHSIIKYNNIWIWFPPKCCYFVVVGGLACLADPRGYASWSFDSW